MPLKILKTSTLMKEGFVIRMSDLLLRFLIISYQLKLMIKMRVELANLTHYAVPFLAAPPPTYAGTKLHSASTVVLCLSRSLQTPLYQALNMYHMIV